MKINTENKIKILTAVCLAGAVVSLSVLFLLSPKQEFSHQENRYLASEPEFGWEQIKSGAYMEEVNTYLSDHFPGRDFFMGLKTKAEILLGRKEINGVYLAEDGYLIEKYEAPVNTEKICRILNGFEEKLTVLEENGRDLERSILLVPTASCILEEKLPLHAPVISQAETISKYEKLTELPVIDCRRELYRMSEENAVYYRTDHHWTSEGAYAGYLTYCPEAGLTPADLDEYEAVKATEEFLGTVYSKVHDYSRSGDTITLYSHPEDRLTVTYTDTGIVADSLYNLDYLEEKDKYSLFLDNLHSLIQIDNETAETDRVLVLIKDSYANSMVPFLTRHFKTIYVFDTRSYKKGPSAFVEEHPEVTDVLLLYNMNTIDTDLGIRGIY